MMKGAYKYFKIPGIRVLSGGESRDFRGENGECMSRDGNVTNSCRSS